MLARKALAGTAGAPKEYVEDVFSTYLWDGNATARNIVNGIDLSGEGGMVWTKYRNTTNNHRLYDTARGATKEIYTSLTNAESIASQSLTAFNADGFSLGTGQPNENTATVVGWTFRKAEKFFDVVTYTGNGSNRTISHNLGSTPGCIMVKRTDTTSSWRVFHRELDPAASLILNSTAAADYPNNTIWNATNPTSTVFSVGTSTDVNANGGTYVAYLFAHDAGGFGDAGSDNVISCGSFTTSAGGTATVTLNYEPQFVILKDTGASGEDWILLDTMRGWANGSNDALLRPNLSSAETSAARGNPISTGFDAAGLSGSSTYIYIAIRRGPMKTPTTGTSVFNVETLGQSSGGVTPGFRSGWPVDMNIVCNKSTVHDTNIADRMRGQNVSYTNLTSAETSNASWKWDQQLGIYDSTSTSTNILGYMFRRAPKFFDVVCYTGTGANRTVSHNLGVAPELMIVACRSSGEYWPVYSSQLGASKALLLQLTGDDDDYSANWNSTAPTSSVFSVDADNRVNASGSTYVAYLFASLSGVSKIGTYTGNGSSVTVTTDFQPRFILVKRTNSTGDWIFSDSARGLVAGNDPFLKLNSTAAEVTNEDWVDITSTSFTVNQTTNNANVNTGTYLYLAIA